MIRNNKLECLPLASFFNLFLHFRVRLRVSKISLEPFTPVSSCRFRQGCKYFSGTNTLAYFRKGQKRFTSLSWSRPYMKCNFVLLFDSSCLFLTFPWVRFESRCFNSIWGQFYRSFCICNLTPWHGKLSRAYYVVLCSPFYAVHSEVGIPYWALYSVLSLCSALSIILFTFWAEHSLLRFLCLICAMFSVKFIVCCAFNAVHSVP
jgi:hypothetical protein